MKQTTLCYMERGDQYLMLHRVKKANDASHDKWIGVGGKYCYLRQRHMALRIHAPLHRFRLER